jgi:hypothetical protein
LNRVGGELVAGLRVSRQRGARGTNRGHRELV